MSSRAARASVGEDYVYLMGHTPFKQYLDFMSSEPIDAQQADMKLAADEWRAADDHVKKLQASEPAWADHPPVQPIAAGLEPLAARVRADPIFQRAFSYVPVDLGVVELDRLVVRQKTVNLVHARRVKEQVGPTPSPETIFRLCLPFDHPTVPARVRSVSDDQVVFISESNDLRFLESVVFEPEQISGYRPLGPVAGVVGLVVGYGSNYLNVIAADGRLVLNNGSHRAYALRDLGITHVPCVIQKVSRPDELEVVAAGALRRTPDVYLRHPRPPALKDYFDPRLRKIVRLAPTVRHIRVTFSFEQTDVPENR